MRVLSALLSRRLPRSGLSGQVATIQVQIVGEPPGTRTRNPSIKRRLVSRRPSCIGRFSRGLSFIDHGWSMPGLPGCTHGVLSHCFHSLPIAHEATTAMPC